MSHILPHPALFVRDTLGVQKLKGNMMAKKKTTVMTTKMKMALMIALKINTHLLFLCN